MRPKKKLSEDQVTIVETLAQYLTAEQIADYLKVGRTTFYEIMKRQPEVSERYKKGRSKAVASIAQSLVKKAMDGDTASQIFYLKTQGGWRETGNINLTSEDGSMSPKNKSIIDRVIERGKKPRDTD